MNNNEAIAMLERAAHEIEMLRKQVERLEPKAQAYDALVKVLDLTGNRASLGYGVDMACEFRKRAKELAAELAELNKDRAKADIDAKRAKAEKEDEAKKAAMHAQQQAYEAERRRVGSLATPTPREETDEQGVTRLVQDTDWRK